MDGNHSEDAQEQHIHDDAQGVLSGTDDKAKEAAEPKSSRGGQTLDLAPVESLFS